MTEDTTPEDLADAFNTILNAEKQELADYIKTSAADLYHASEQLERAEEFFEDTGWDVIGQTILED